MEALLKSGRNPRIQALSLQQAWHRFLEEADFPHGFGAEALPNLAEGSRESLRTKVLPKGFTGILPGFADEVLSVYNAVL